MRILVTGSNGQLGWELRRQGPRHGFQIIPYDLPELDITKKSEVNRVIHESGASLVVNAAAYTAVDKAESEPDLAFGVNRDGPAHLAGACQKENIPLVHISTDYVFDGKKEGPYVETDLVAPLGVYGRSKLAGETEVKSRLKEHIILRTAWLYGVHGHNFVKTMLRLGQLKRVIRIVDDQYGCPTYAADLAESIFRIATQLQNENISWGTYHYCGRGATTWFGFGQRVFDIIRDFFPLKVERVDPVTSEEYRTVAKRPSNSVLDCSLLKDRFSLETKDWASSLQEMLSGLLF